MDHHTKEDLLNQVDKNYQVNLSQRNFSIGPKVLASVLLRPFSLTNYSYNRTSAKNYADLYWNGTGPYYLREPGDCTNFVSQALYAGEGKNPTNTSGMTTDPNRSYYTDWYYVWNNSGSLPWTQVDTQYNFITGNTNKIGPYGSGTTGYCNVQVGDVVQLYDSSQNPPWFHEAIISVVSNPCAGLQFYYADAHTTDRFQYPVINWSIYQLRYIKVSGWRGN